jgi:dihydrofolate reductase
MSAPLIISSFITLDGVMEAPGGELGHPHTGWVVPYEDGAQIEYKFGEVKEAGSLLIGRLTYDSFASAWPGYKGAFADRMNAMPKYVPSTTLRDPAWNNTTVIRGNVGDAIRQLKARETKPVLVTGSRRLTHWLIRERLVDEIRLTIFPVILGSGDRFWPTLAEPLRLTPGTTTRLPSGVIIQSYLAPQ